MNFCNFYVPIRQVTRSYFRFHKTSKTEDFAPEKFIFSKRRPNISEPVLVNKEHVSHDIVFRTVRDAIKPRNCVLFFPHINSSPDSVEKICSIYHSYALDVVTVAPKNNFYSLAKGQSTIIDLINKLSGNNLPLDLDKFLVHASSTGVFLYALLSNHLALLNGSFNVNRIKGQIFDRLILGDPVLARKLFGTTASTIFAPGNDSFNDIGQDFANSPIHIETLVYHSFDDAFASSTEMLIQGWRKKRLDVSVSSWKNCNGEDNYSSHPMAYTRALDSFLMKIGFA